MEAYEFKPQNSKRPLLTPLFLLMFGRDLFSPTIYKRRRRDVRQPSIPRTLWRGFLAPHHEAWIESELNQREYCEAYGIPLKAFGNWRAKFKAEPRLPAPKLLYRRRGVSHTLSHRLSHSLRHMTNHLPSPIVPPAREGHRRTFSEADKRRIVEETGRPGASLSEVARSYGIAARVLFRWKLELAQAAPVFVAVEITDAIPPTEEHAS